MASGRCARAKKPSHIEVTPDRLRQTCRRQLVGMMDWRPARAQISSSTTEGRPRKTPPAAAKPRARSPASRTTP
ncbi:Uncharacterised protein [Bordetella pertussis]|nr:Uncharacterised protein [Bordetella pertussis]